MTLEQIKQVLAAQGYRATHETKRALEYQAGRDGQYIYLRPDSGLPNRVRVVVHPKNNVAGLAALPGINWMSSGNYFHGSNMLQFPKRMHKGKNPISYGHQFEADAPSTFTKLLEEISCLPAT
jgi:hypothetical protein